VTIDVVDVGGLSVAGVLRVPIGGTDDSQRNSAAPGYARGLFGASNNQSPCCHDTVISGDTCTGKG
jgi:hypothetical protein